MRHLISNIISCFIWRKPLRDKVRTMIRYPQTWEYFEYVRWFARNMKQCKIKTTVGYDKHVFKFPLMNDGRDVAYREKRIVDAFCKISPIKIPAMTIIPYKDIVIRKYEFAHGKLLSDFEPKVIAAHRAHIAKQIAKMLYVVGKSDPADLRDLKTSSKGKPGYLYGWFQGDIWQNFMLDEKTFDITFFIDWEDTKFQSFMPALYVASHNWDKFGYKYLIVDIMAEYTKLYFGGRGKK